MKLISYIYRDMPKCKGLTLSRNPCKNSCAYDYCYIHKNQRPQPPKIQKIVCPKDQYTIRDDEYIDLVTDRILYFTDGHSMKSARDQAIKLIKIEDDVLDKYKEYLQKKRER